MFASDVSSVFPPFPRAGERMGHPDSNLRPLEDLNVVKTKSAKVLDNVLVYWYIKCHE